MNNMPRTPEEFGQALDEAYLVGRADAANDAYRRGIMAATGRRSLARCQNRDVQHDWKLWTEFPVIDQ